jgi:hypothetical protein
MALKAIEKGGHERPRKPSRSGDAESEGRGAHLLVRDPTGATEDPEMRRFAGLSTYFRNPS